MAIERFRDDDRYRQWARDNPTGFVLILGGSDKNTPIMFHRVGCRCIGTEGEHHAQETSFKDCATTLSKLEASLRSETVLKCEICTP